MKLAKVIIKDFQQFKHLELDLTHPKTGEPLEKFCLIGANGTGKSTILKILQGAFEVEENLDGNIEIDIYDPFQNLIEFSKKTDFGYSVDITEINRNKTKYSITDFKGQSEINFWIQSNKKLEGKSIFIYSPSESRENQFFQVEDVPQTSVNEALKLFKRFPERHTISDSTIKDFWTILIYHIKKREENLINFQNKLENLDKTIREVNTIFNRYNHDILEKIAQLWNKILDKAGLEFDYENAKNPIQLTDNLHAYIRFKATGEQIEYNQLSTGIREFIFKLGHIYSLYFNRNIERGFLFVDEPENSLFPDFLYDLVETYCNITENTQIGMATHNPIIAAQFESYERFILEFGDDGYVYARRGVTPIGDDPNDILIKDFGVRNILGKKGVEKWEEYIRLKTLIPLENDKSKKRQMMRDFMKIGNDYNFGEYATA